MRIAFLHFYQSTAQRGAETFVRELSSRLSKKHQLLVVPSPSTAPVFTTQLSLTRRFFLDPYSVAVFSWTLKSLSQLARFRPDVVIAFNGGWQTPILRLWTWRHQAKLIIPGQSGPGWDDRWNLLWHPDVFVALTNSQAEWVKRASPWPKQRRGKRLVVIPNGVDLEKFTPQGKKAPLRLQKPIILTVAATDPYKRVEESIRAVAGLKKGSLLLIGSGPQDEKINKLGGQLLGPDRFLHLPSVPHRELPVYYRAADLFTLVSAKSEAFGIVYLEALACNLPVVATDDASRRGIVGQAGIFVTDPIDTAGYTAALKSAIKRDWADLPRRQAAKFSWDKVAQNYLGVVK